MAMRAVLVDDEPLARRRLRDLLVAYDDLEIVGEAADGESAVALVRDLRPRLLFLDVQMPLVDGFGVVERLAESERPLIVFVTAFEQYALDAFRASAVQYLLKPIDRDDLRTAVLRVRQLAHADSDSVDAAAVSSLLAELQRSRAMPRRIVVKVKGRTLIFDVADIDWLEAAGNYVRLHIAGSPFLLRESMSGMEERLDPRQFVRIHRSAIVNLQRIREFHPISHGEYSVLLRDGTSLTLSRIYRDRLESLVGPL